MLRKVGKETDSDEMVGIMELSGKNEKKKTQVRRKMQLRKNIVQKRERKIGETKKAAIIDNFRNDVIQHTRTPFLTIPGSTLCEQ